MNEHAYEELKTGINNSFDKKLEGSLMVFYDHGNLQTLQEDYNKFSTHRASALRLALQAHEQWKLDQINAAIEQREKEKQAPTPEPVAAEQTADAPKPKKKKRKA